MNPFKVPHLSVNNFLPSIGYVQTLLRRVGEDTSKKFMKNRLKTGLFQWEKKVENQIYTTAV